MSKPLNLDSKSPSKSVDVEVVFVPSSRKKSTKSRGVKAQPALKAAYQRHLDRLASGNAPVGKNKSLGWVRFGGQGKAQHVLFVGIGEISELNAEKFRHLGALIAQKVNAEKCKSAWIHLDQELSSESDWARGLAEGLVLSQYSFTKHSSQTPASGHTLASVSLTSSDRTFQSALVGILREVKATGEAVTITRDWSNEPSNFGTPEYFAEQAVLIGKANGLKVTVMNEAQAKKENMNLFLAVGQGSEREGKIVVVEYQPKQSTADTKTIALVGKGVTFDSGGISIKPSLRMEEMKHDMTGAATLMGATVLAAQMKVPHRIVTILAFTENMPSGNALQPGNVIRARNGKTVEIFNTDAEGRLILADVLDYAHEFKPDWIVDAATLTGAVGIALGKHCAAILGNDDDLIHSIQDVGTLCGERTWQLPLFDEYFEDMKSDVADMKNSCNDGAGGTIRGAIFLKQFIRKGTRWAHLDIAATAWNVTHLPYFPKRGASGQFVRTIAHWIRSL